MNRRLLSPGASEGRAWPHGAQRRLQPLSARTADGSNLLVRASLIRVSTLVSSKRRGILLRANTKPGFTLVDGLTPPTSTLADFVIRQLQRIATYFRARANLRPSTSNSSFPESPARFLIRRSSLRRRFSSCRVSRRLDRPLKGRAEIASASRWFLRFLSLLKDEMTTFAADPAANLCHAANLCGAAITTRLHSHSTRWRIILLAVRFAHIASYTSGMAAN
jgi:hypothetical protein